MNDCSMCNPSFSDTCHFVKITCSIKFRRGGHRLFMVFRAGAHHSLRSCLVIAGLARSCLVFPPLRIARCSGGEKAKEKKSQDQLQFRSNTVAITTQIITFFTVRRRYKQKHCFKDKRFGTELSCFRFLLV